MDFTNLFIKIYDLYDHTLQIVGHSIVKSFADDTRATKLIKTIEDVIRLQEDLQHIYKWTHDNNMKLNDVKFELLRYGKKRTY